MTFVTTPVPKLEPKYLFQKLVLDNCLTLGQHPQVTSKKINKYLLGSRSTLEIFKLYELRYLLLRIYPLLHTLFYSSRVNAQLTFKEAKKQDKKWVQPKNEFGGQNKFIKKQALFTFKHKNLIPQVLFATTNPVWAQIIYEAAKVCNMPYHQKRWLNGSITAALAYLYDQKLWSHVEDNTQTEIAHFFRQQWSQNKENWAKSKEKTRYYGHSRWPSLIIVPDVANNAMILAEAKKVGLPVIGLVNSQCNLDIEYPIFAQDQSVSSIHFFCHFLATLIAKEMVYLQHKRYIKTNVFSLKKKESFKAKEMNFQKRKETSFQMLVARQKIKEPWKKPFFFKHIIPMKKKLAQRNLLQERLALYPLKTYFLIPQKKRHPKQRFQPQKPRYYTQPLLLHIIFKRFIYYLQYASSDTLDDYFLLNIRKLKKNVREKKDIFPEAVFLKTEKRKKYLFQRTNLFFEPLEKIYIRNILLRKFLWINKKLTSSWIHKNLLPKQKRFVPTSYYWWTLRQIVSDLKWSGHKHILPKMLRLNTWRQRTYKEALYKNYKRRKKYRRMLFKKRWKTWVRRTINPSRKKNFRHPKISN